MTPISASAAASACLAPLPLRRPIAAAISPPPALLLPHLERGDASTRRSCASPWRRPSAPPTPPAPGTGRQPTTPARRRRSCSCANTDGDARKRRIAGRLPAMLAKIAGLLPTHTRRSEESQTLQQFSTPIPLGFAATGRRDHAGRPRAGAFGRHRAARHPCRDRRRLARPQRARRDARGLLSLLFPGIPVTRFDAAQIDDHLDAGAVPSVVLMNPPFSVVANVEGRVADARSGTSPRRWRASPRAAAGRHHRARTSRPTIRPGATPSSACRSAAASCSRRRSTARSMPSTAPPSRRA